MPQESNLTREDPDPANEDPHRGIGEREGSAHSRPGTSHDGPSGGGLEREQQSDPGYENDQCACGINDELGDHDQ
jgi:hypothetical protein